MLLLTANTWRATKLPYAAIKDQLASINNCRQSHDVEPSGDGSTHQHRLVASSAMPENLATQPQHQQINDSGILHHGVLNITKSSRDNCSFCRAPQSHAAKTRDICCAARKRKKQYSFRITRTRDTPRVAAVICGVADSCEVARLCFFFDSCGVTGVQSDPWCIVLHARGWVRCVLLAACRTRRGSAGGLDTGSLRVLTVVPSLGVTCSRVEVGWLGGVL
jgi:hypothetical protein